MDGLTGIGYWCRLHIVDADSEPHSYVDDDKYRHFEGRWGEDGEGAIPDMSSPGTLGLIEELILEHPAVGHLQTHRTSEGDASIYLHGLDADELWRIEQVPRAEALVAAVEFLGALGGEQ